MADNSTESSELTKEQIEALQAIENELQDPMLFSSSLLPKKSLETDNGYSFDTGSSKVFRKEQDRSINNSPTYQVFHKDREIVRPEDPGPPPPLPNGEKQSSETYRREDERIIPYPVPGNIQTNDLTPEAKADFNRYNASLDPTAGYIPTGPTYLEGYKEPKDIWVDPNYNKQFSVSDLKNRISGINQLSKFYFHFPRLQIGYFENGSYLNELITNQNREILKNLYFYSENITIPMRGITTDPHTYSNGFRFESPVSSNYGDGDIAITMNVDNGYEIYDFFMNWMNKIHNKKTGYFSFHNRYVTNLAIYQLNHVGVRFSDFYTFEDMIAIREKNFFNYQVDLKNCYPKSVTAIEFKHDSKDERVKITVNFTYEQIYYNRDF